MHDRGRWFAGLLGLGVLLGAGLGAPALAHRPDLLAAAAQHEFGGGLPEDTIAVAQHHGLDYSRVVRTAGHGSIPALRRILRFTVGTGLDAASSEGHAAVLGELLRRVGDAKFAMALRRESPAVRQAVLDMVRYDTALSPGGLSRRYPRTAATGTLVRVTRRGDTTVGNG